MFLPAQYSWFEPVLIASVVVFISALLGNWITFRNRALSALVSAIVFAIVYGAIVAYFSPNKVSVSVVVTPSPSAPAQTQN